MDLMTKTFLIIGGMLIITTIAARFNKALETKTEATIAIVGSFFTLFICFILADQYPINLWACAAFSGFTGWILGPAVGNIGYAIKFGKFAEKLAGERELVRTYYYNIRQESNSDFY